MGALVKQLNHFDQIKGIISPVLSYFDTRSLDKTTVDQLSIAADLAFSDPLLLEKFELWNKEREDDAFLFHVRRFFEKRDQKILTAAERDFSPRREEIESSIKETVRERQKKIFSERITQLAIEHNLLKNEQLGAFLGVSTEQARKYRSGENKPQLGTLKQISDKFNVSIEFLCGLSSDR